ncbi:MAG: hypothetical protein ACE5IR_01955 [bacterium]
MKTQIFRIAAFLLISSLYLTGCEKDGPAGFEEVLPPDFSDDLDPAWSPDGKKIAYSTGDGGRTFIIDLIEGGPPEKYLDNAFLSDWSPDGSTIAFEYAPVFGDTCCGPFGIYFIKPDGSGRRLFLPGAHSPAWLPDGQKLAFVSGGIGVINKDGSGLRAQGVEGFFPAWSPDGSKIAYSTGEGGRTFIIDLAKEAPPPEIFG